MRRAFTLIELLLVIGVIAILAAIVIIAVNPVKQLQKALDAKRDHGANQLEKAVAQYQIAKGKLPNDVAILTGTGSARQACAQGVAEARAAARFASADGDYLIAANSESLQTGDIDFTFAGWIYKDSNADFQYVVDKYDSIWAGEWLLHNDATGALTFTITNLAIKGGVTSGVLSTNAWHFFVVWHDAGADTVHIQVDDGLVASAPTSGAPASTAAPLRFGAYYETPTHFFNGREDSMAFWKRTLTAGERAWLYNAGRGRAYAALGDGQETGAALKNGLVSWWDMEEAGGSRLDAHGSNHLTDNSTVASAEGWSGADASCVGLDVVTPTFIAQLPRDATEGCANYSGYRVFRDGSSVRVIPSNKGKSRSEAGSTLHCGLVGHWTLDEATGLTAGDASGNGNHGVIAGSPTSSASVPPVMRFADPYSLVFNGLTDEVRVPHSAATRSVGAQGTVAGWIKRPSVGPGLRVLLDVGSTGANGLVVWSDIGDGRVGANFGAQAGWSNIESTSVPANDVWTHVAFTWGPAGERLYVNGIQEASHSSPSDIIITTPDAYIGSNDGTRYHNGALDDVRLYNRTLSAEEVASLAAGNN